MAYGEQLFTDETFELENHPKLFNDQEILATLALSETVELN